MNRFLFTATLFLVAVHCASAGLTINPAAKAVGAVDSQTETLYQKLAGSTWSYGYRGQTYELSFGQGGTVGFQWWPGATWRITGPNSIAIRNTKLGEMPVRFNAEFKRFVAKDWSGGDAIGTLRNPDAKVTE